MNLFFYYPPCLSTPRCMSSQEFFFFFSTILLASAHLGAWVSGTHYVEVGWVRVPRVRRAPPDDIWKACWHQWKIAHGTNNPNRSDVTCTTVPTDFPQRPVCVHYSPHKGRPKHARTLSAKKDKYVKYDKICHLGSRSKYKTGPNHSRDKFIPTA
jgi:hypothetical protein